MPARRSCAHGIAHGTPRAARCFAALALPVLAGLSGCEGQNFAPPCPSALLLKPAADVVLYRPGGGHDLTMLQLQGSITGAQGECRLGDKAGTVESTLTISMAFQRGPAAPTRHANIPYFVAVAEGERILNKRVYVAQATFPPNTDRVSVTMPPVDVIVPVTRAKSGAAYTIWLGFQLTPEQMEGVAR